MVSIEFLITSLIVVIEPPRAENCFRYAFSAAFAGLGAKHALSEK